MSKRQADEEVDQRTSAPRTNKNDSPASKAQDEHMGEMGEIEDLEGDDSDDEIAEIDGSDIEDDDNDDSDKVEDGGRGKALKAIQEDETLDENAKVNVQRVYIPQRSAPLQEGEVMEPDMSAYHMLHLFSVDHPSLSFDIIPDNLGDERTTYPQTSYLVTGTQAAQRKDNSITVLKLDQMGKTYLNDDENDEEEGDDELEPRMEYLKLPTLKPTNRIRMNPHCQKTGEYFTASMSESGEVFIWDISPHMKWFDTPGFQLDKTMNRPAHTIRSHGNVEGYGLDWSPRIQTGALLTGDMDGRVFLTRRTQSGWTTDKTPFQADTGLQERSIEDIQWSPSEDTVFATCGTDGHIRIWDVRSSSKKPKISVKASDTDVNVISWNKKQNNLLCSGHDDGQWGVWDLRKFGSKDADKSAVVASFDYHKQPITSIEFSPLDESAVAVGSEDNTVTLWDLSVEADDEEVKKQREEIGLGDLPPQLMFVHWQPEVKEVHFNKQFPGGLAATGGEGFSLFKTISF